MKVGLYVVNCNYRDFLPWALNSIQKQTRKPDVLIFIDDASVDDSVEILNKYYGNMHFDEIIVNETNLGTVKTINKAVSVLGEKYKCDMVVGLSADDTFAPTYLEETEKILLEAPKDVGWVYTYVRRIGDENQYDIHPEWDKDHHARTPFCHGSSLIKYDAWASVGGLPDVPREEDWQMFKNMAEIGWKGKLLAKPLMRWRKHKYAPRTMSLNAGGIKRGELWTKSKTK